MQSKKTTGGQTTRCWQELKEAELMSTNLLQQQSVHTVLRNTGEPQRRFVMVHHLATAVRSRESRHLRVGQFACFAVQGSSGFFRQDFLAFQIGQRLVEVCHAPQTDVIAFTLNVFSDEILGLRVSRQQLPLRTGRHTPQCARTAQRRCRDRTPPLEAMMRL